MYIFYNQIKNYALLYFEEKNEKLSLEIDFYKDFAISENLETGFITYDNENNKFLLSIPNGISKYNSVKNTKPLNLINVEDELQNKYYSSFTTDELSQIMDFYNIDFIKSRVQFGGGCINDTIIHLATSEMGFGGVGESGMGAYHGREGFDAFSHRKSIVDKKTFMDLPMRYRPYKKIYEKMLHIFLR